MKVSWLVPFSIMLAAPVVALVACGGGGKDTKTPVAAVSASAQPVVREVHERVVPHMCSTRTKLAQLLGRTEPSQPTLPDQLAESAPPPSTESAVAGGNVGSDAYRKIAPATAFIHTQEGMGTGIVVDPKGYVLTNYHVIEDGEKKDFVVSARVSFGELTPTGRMVRVDKEYDAVVVKADPVRDMALLRVKDPPAKLAAATFAKSAPQIGEKVMSVGHAGIGFLWAAKSCHVASIGERQQDASILAAFECGRQDPSKKPEEAEAAKKSCEATKKKITDVFAEETQGLAVQTDCAISHGDSGGPLVNARGEMVGLNQSVSRDLATASFHIHLDEMRDFVATHGDSAVAILPDPLCDGGVNPTLLDLDLDGVPETVHAKGTQNAFGLTDRQVFLIDLDQDHFSQKRSARDSLDTELAVLLLQHTLYIFYDTDNDSRFDVVLVDSKADGRPESGHTIGKDGKLTPLTDLPKHDIDVAFIKDEKLHPRLGKVASVLATSKFTSPEALKAGAADQSLPDPVRALGTKGRFVDSDKNGKPDAIYVSSTYTQGILVDADEDSIGTFKPGDDADEVMKSGKLELEFSFITEDGKAWASYDTDNDGSFDLMLTSDDANDEAWLYAMHAFRLDKKGAPTPAPEFIGRKLVRPGLIGIPRMQAILDRAPFDNAGDEGLGSFPVPRKHTQRAHFREVKGLAKGVVIESTHDGGSEVLIDLDRTIKIGPKDTATQAVTAPTYHAEVAMMYHGSFVWVFYDTDADNEYDYVLVLPDDTATPKYAFRMTKGASGVEVKSDPSLVPGRALRHKTTFKDKTMGPKLKTAAQALFKSSIVEE